nr:Retrovirus-related Pol polyprotein from transposon TNT 1-94 [Ipomoea batatas]
MSFAVKTGSGKGRGRFDKLDKSHLLCTHCKKSGHDVSQCFEIHGYPEWYENRGNNARGGRSGRGRGVPRANATLTNKFTDKCGISSSHLFSADQWKALTGLISGTKVSDDQLNGKFDTRLWIIDTGASRHVTGDSTRMTNVKDIFHCLIGLPNGKTVVATQEGSVRLTDKITLNHVLYIPSLSCNLISVSQLNDDMQSSVHFNSYMCAIHDQSREMIGTGVRRDGLYYFKETDSVHLEYLRSFNKACEVCFRAKQPREKFPLSNNRASRIFEKIQCDLWGPYRHQSSCGARYFFTTIDDYSRAVWIYLLIDKTEVLKMFLSFVAMIDRQFSQSIKVVQSDNGAEFKCLRAFFFCYWNSVSNFLCGNSSTKCLPSYNTIRVFGCLCFAHNQKAKGDKFASKSRKCIFVGYPFGKKGWKLFDLESKEFFVSRDVKFFEDDFPFPLTDTTAMSHEEFVHEDFSVILEEAEPSSTNEPNPQPEPSSTPEPTSQPESNLTPEFNSQTEHHTSNLVPNNQDQNVEMGRGMRNKVPSVWLRDYVINSTVAKSLSSVTLSPQSSSERSTTVLLPLSSLPVGFRFYLTDEELINHYLKLKINGSKAEVNVIRKIDICKLEPWDLPGE